MQYMVLGFESLEFIVSDEQTTKTELYMLQDFLAAPFHSLLVGRQTKNSTQLTQEELGSRQKNRQAINDAIQRTARVATQSKKTTTEQHQKQSRMNLWNYSWQINQ